MGGAAVHFGHHEGPREGAQGPQAPPRGHPFSRLQCNLENGSSLNRKWGSLGTPGGSQKDKFALLGGPPVADFKGVAPQAACKTRSRRHETGTIINDSGDEPSTHAMPNEGPAEGRAKLQLNAAEGPAESQAPVEGN